MNTNENITNDVKQSQKSSTSELREIRIKRKSIPDDILTKLEELINLYSIDGIRKFEPKDILLFGVSKLSDKDTSKFHKEFLTTEEAVHLKLKEQNINGDIDKAVLALAAKALGINQ